MIAASPRTLTGRTSAALAQRPRLAALAGISAVWAGIASWLAVDFSGRITDWAVMSDELLYTKLAVAIADSGSPIPELHGTHVEILNQLYPLLLAPLFVGSDVPGAFHAAHVLNAVVMASACIPAYLVARQVIGRVWSVVVAALSVTVPWMVLTGVLMTESAAYPAFLWAVLACLAAVRSPGHRRDLLAVAGLVLAVLARTQFVVLALVLPVAVFVDALAAAPPGSILHRLRAAARTSVERHRLLAAAYLVAAAVIVAVAVLGSIGDALGVYSSTLHGSVLPSGVWRATTTHLDAVAIGCGLVPLVLGGGWMLAAATDLRERRDASFAVFGLLTVAVLTVETASFDVRFGGQQIVRDRYLFYVVPLLLVGTAKALDTRAWRRVALGAAAVTVFFAATVHWLDLPTGTAYWVDSPERIVNGNLADQSGSLSTPAFAALAGGLLGAVLVAALAVVPRRLLAIAVVAFLAPFTVLSTRSEIDAVVAGNSSSGRPLAGPSGTLLDWIDTVLPGGPTAAMIPFAQSPEFALDAVRWWDVEFWNRTVGRELVGPDRNFSYTPFPEQVLAPDWSTGRLALRGGQPPFVVFALDDSRFRLAGVRHAENLGFRVLLADRPYHLDWMTRGLDVDGWDRSGRRATVRVYPGRGSAERIDVALTLTAPDGAASSYVIDAGASARRAGTVPAGSSTTESVSVCVPAGSFADLTVSSAGGKTIPGPPLSFAVVGSRRVGVRVGPIETTRTGQAC
jgi:hypothetical protein